MENDRDDYSDEGGQERYQDYESDVTSYDEGTGQHTTPGGKENPGATNFTTAVSTKAAHATGRAFIPWRENMSDATTEFPTMRNAGSQSETVETAHSDTQAAAASSSGDQIPTGGQDTDRPNAISTSEALMLRELTRSPPPLPAAASTSSQQETDSQELFKILLDVLQLPLDGLLVAQQLLRERVSRNG